MSEQPVSRLSELPSWLISQVYARSHRLLSQGFAAAGSHGYQYRLLVSLHDHGPASQADLSRRAHIDGSDVVAALNDLAAGGLVKRSPDPADRRRNVISITAAGVRALGPLDKVLAGVQEELVAPLSVAERAELVRLLQRLLPSREEG